MQLYYLPRSRDRTGESLNRLEREGGGTREASRHYREVLALWAGADQGLPEWKEAESYLVSAS